jgi:hypothetical protein
VLLRQGEGPLPRQGGGQKGRKRLGQQPSHVTSGSARYTLDIAYEFLEAIARENTPKTAEDTTLHLEQINLFKTKMSQALLPAQLSTSKSSRRSKPAANPMR